MAEDIDFYDTSNYPKNHTLYGVRNKKFLGKMKDECEGRVIKKAVAIRPGMYSVLEENQTKYQESQEGEKECGRKRDQARALQRSAFPEKAVLARDEHSSQRGSRDKRNACEKVFTFAL